MNSRKGKIGISRFMLLFLAIFLFFSAGLHTFATTEKVSHKVVKALEEASFSKDISAAHNKSKITKFLYDDDYCCHVRRNSDNWQFNSPAMIFNINHTLFFSVFPKICFYTQDQRILPFSFSGYLTDQLLC